MFRLRLLALVPMAALVCTGCGSKDKKTAAVPTTAAASCSNDMFAKYKIAGFGAVNASIITKATAPGMETSLGNSFVLLAAKGPARVATFTTNLANFLVAAYGGPKNYTGPDMKTAHTGLNITAAQYNNFISMAVVPALKDNGVTAADVTNCFAPVVTDPAFVATIVGH
jgi:hypothetical protein